jgi:DNA replication licensing factor MCM4
MSEIDLSSPLNYGTPGSLSSVHTPQSGIRGTPIRMRPDIRTDRRIRQVNVNSDPVRLHNICNIIVVELEGMLC